MHPGPAIEKDIDVDRARSFGWAGASAAKLQLDFLDSGQQHHGEQFGLRFNYQVEKRALLFEVDRFGFVDRGDALDRQVAPMQAIECGLQHLFALADVGTEGQVDSFHGFELQ